MLEGFKYAFERWDPQNRKWVNVLSTTGTEDYATGYFQGFMHALDCYVGGRERPTYRLVGEHDRLILFEPHQEQRK